MVDNSIVRDPVRKLKKIQKIYRKRADSGFEPEACHIHGIYMLLCKLPRGISKHFPEATIIPLDQSAGGCRQMGKIWTIQLSTNQPVTFNLIISNEGLHIRGKITVPSTTLNITYLPDYNCLFLLTLLSDRQTLRSNEVIWIWDLCWGFLIGLLNFVQLKVW